jgi:FeS assembly SUF system regulator
VIRLTKFTDYGIVLLTHFAARRDAISHNAPDLAAETRLPLPMVSKILKTLAREGILLSHRGVKGGYSLARPAAEITVRHVIDALEGPIAITECIEHGASDCNIEQLCPVRGNWSRINRAVELALDGITLEEMAQPLTETQFVRLGAGFAASRERT